MAKFKAEESFDGLSLDEMKIMNYVTSVGVPNKDKRLIDEDRSNRSKGHQKDVAEKDRVQANVDHEVDLHGLTVDEAKFAILEAIDICERSKYKTLRVIQGGGGPITGMMKRLIQSDLRSKVLDVIREKNNPGSTILKINLSQSLSLAQQFKNALKKR